MNKNRNTPPTIRWQLLSTVSALALLGSAYTAEAAGSDADRPLLWVELGGQLDGLSDSQQALDPPFMASITRSSLLTALDVQRPPAYVLGEEGKLSFQPGGSDWIFSVGVRFGRSKIARHHHHQTQNAYIPVAPKYFRGTYFDIGTKYPFNHVRFADGRSSLSERHLVLDFQAGKDVGLGMFGGHGTSVLSAGVRFAQFNSKRNVSLRGEPDVQYLSPTKPLTFTQFRSEFKYVPVHFHDYAATLSDQRSFHGLGPSLGWNASVPLAGSLDGGEWAFDWSANVAILFGRQRTNGHHQSTTKSYYGSRWNFRQARDGGLAVRNGTEHFIESGGFIAGGRNSFRYSNSTSTNFDRIRSVTVPNLGAAVGVSYRIKDFKVSLGYRADFFFNVIDGGINTRKEENRGFYGPFASVSVGLGD